MHIQLQAKTTATTKLFKTQKLKSRNPKACKISLFYLFMLSRTHFQRSWMAQEKYRKAVVGYWSVHGEETVGFLHCSCSRQHSAGTSAYPYRYPPGTVHPVYRYTDTSLQVMSASRFKVPNFLTEVTVIFTFTFTRKSCQAQHAVTRWYSTGSTVQYHGTWCLYRY